MFLSIILFFKLIVGQKQVKTCSFLLQSYYSFIVCCFHLFLQGTLFQCSFFLRLTTLLTWLKSTLLLKNKWFDKHIYMKTQCLQTNKMQHYCGKENAWVAGWVRKEVALINSFIYAREKKTRLKRVWIRSTKVGWIYQLTTDKWVHIFPVFN